MHNIKVTTEELFELLEMLKEKIEYKCELIPLYMKLATYEIPTDNVEPNLDYEISEYKPRRKNGTN